MKPIALKINKKHILFVLQYEFYLHSRLNAYIVLNIQSLKTLNY